MSMNGQYLRVTRDELERAMQDPHWALEFAEQLQEEDEDNDPDPEDARTLTTHSAWNAIGFILARAEFPIDIVHGDQPLADGEDWGNGPPGCLLPERVHSAAIELRSLSFDKLTEDITPADLDHADVYPQIWDEPESLDWVRSWYAPLIPFFDAAARDDHAIIVWID